MSLEQLQPFAGQHAIQSSTFAMDFATELDVSEVSTLRASATGLKGDFPDIKDQRRTTFSVAMFAGQSTAPAATHDVGGFILNRPSPASTPAQPTSLRTISVTRENLIATVFDYTRWDRFKADIDRYMNILLAPINSHKGISSIGLQIVDVFNWRGDPGDLVLSEVFRDGSRYLAPNSLTKEALLWHSHHGFLSEQNAPLGFQQLDNINVSRNVQNGTHQIQILTSHKATFSKPIYKFIDVNRENLTRILDQLHLKNKYMLSETLSDPMLAKIGLNATKD